MSETTTLQAIYADSLKSELVQDARRMGLKGISSMRKDELIQKMLEWMKNPENAARRLSILTNHQMLLLNNAMGECANLEPHELESAGAVCETDYAYLVNEPVQITMTASGIERKPVYKLYIPEDLKDVIRTVNTPQFYMRREVSSWLKQCIDYCEIVYGIFPVKVLAEVCALDKMLETSEEEIRSALADFPWELTGCFMKDDNVIVANDLAEEEDFQELLKEQGDMLFDLPNYMELLDVLQHLYPSSTILYDDLLEYCVKEMGMSKKDATDFSCDVWNGLVMNKDGRPTIMMALQEAEISKAGKLRELLEACDYGTRKRGLRGWTKKELDAEENRKAEEKAEKEALVRDAQRVQAEKRLEALRAKDSGAKKAAPSAPQKQFVLPKVNPGVKKLPRVYPNDPCPCGSGKKYKKCCGKGK